MTIDMTLPKILDNSSPAQSGQTLPQTVGKYLVRVILLFRVLLSFQSQEEEAQQNALDMLLKKKVGKSKTEDLESTGEISIDGEIYVMPPDIGKGNYV